MEHEWQEYDVNGLEMRGMTVSRATTAVTTAGNSNVFHLESTHSSIRPRNGEKEVEEKARELQKTNNSEATTKGSMCAYIFSCPSVATK